MRTPPAAESIDNSNAVVESTLSEQFSPSGILQEQDSIEDTFYEGKFETTLSIAALLEEFEDQGDQNESTFDTVFTEAESDDDEDFLSAMEEKKQPITKLMIDGSNWYDVQRSINTSIREIGGAKIWLQNKKVEDLTSKEEVISTKLVQLVMNHFAIIIDISSILAKKYETLQLTTAKDVHDE